MPWMGSLPFRERVFEGLYDLDSVAIGLNPESDPLMGLFQVFEDQFAAADLVEGEDQGSKRPEQRAQAARHPCFEMRAIDRVAAQGSSHCTIGRDEGHVRSQVEAFEQGSGIGGAATGGNGDGNAGIAARP